MHLGRAARVFIVVVDTHSCELDWGLGRFHFDVCEVRRCIEDESRKALVVVVLAVRARRAPPRRPGRGFAILN